MVYIEIDMVLVFFDHNSDAIPILEEETYEEKIV
jgi:hypothetical protein